MLAGFFRPVAAAVCAAVILVGPAWADLKGFNAAVKAGDYRAAAQEASALWQSWDKSHPDTATVAREFGYASLMAGNYEAAREFGRFLVDNGATLKNPDDQPTTSVVLYRLADFRIGKGDAERTALRVALAGRVAAPGVDMTSVLAWQSLYISDWSAADWPNAEKDAATAAEFYGRAANQLTWRQREAELQVAAAQFLANRVRISTGRNEAYNVVADVHDRIVANLDATATPAARKQLWPLKWRAEAWALAIASYLDSSYTQIGSNISTALDHRALVEPKVTEVAEDPATASLPLCKATLEGPRLITPTSQGFRGVVGSVIARLETDASGKVIKVDVIAAVPAEGFADRVVETYSKWRLAPDKGAVRSNCRLNSRNNYVKVPFQIL